MISLADVPAGSTGGGTLTGILTSAVVAAVLAAVVTGLFTRRKLSAEATKIITDAASGVVADLRAERASDQLELRGLKAENRAQANALRVHSVWDRQAYEALQRQGIILPEPPPLYPDTTPTPAGS